MKRALAIAVLLQAVMASAETATPGTRPAEGFAERTATPPAEEAAKAPEKPAAPAVEPAPEFPDVPAGALLQVGIADSSSFSPLVSTNNFGLGNNATLPTLVSTIRAGAYLGKHHELSLGLSFSFLQISSGGGNQTTIFDAVLAPTYRYHFVPLRPWGLSPFLQAELLLGVDNIGFSGSSSTTTPEFGATAGIGAEYMLGDRFGLLINAGVRFISLSLGSSGSGTSVLGFQVWGSAAASLHF